MMNYCKVVLCSLLLLVLVVIPVSAVSAETLNMTFAEFLGAYGVDDNDVTVVDNIDAFMIDGDWYDISTYSEVNEIDGLTYAVTEFQKNGVTVYAGRYSNSEGIFPPAWFKLQQSKNTKVYQLCSCIQVPGGSTRVTAFDGWQEAEGASKRITRVFYQGAGPPDKELLQGKLMIWWPPYDGYRFSTSVQSVQYSFGIQGTDSSQLYISITGADSKQVLSRDIQVIDGWIYGTCKDEIQLNVGQNNITVTATIGSNSVSATRIVEVLAGQVDEDGDGLDDRTGMPIWPNDPINWDGATDGPPPLPGENATIFDYIKWFADSLLYSLGLLVTTIKSFMSGIAQVTRMFADIFKWLPSELIALMILGICMTIILRVLGR